MKILAVVIVLFFLPVNTSAEMLTMTMEEYEALESDDFLGQINKIKIEDGNVFIDYDPDPHPLPNTPDKATPIPEPSLLWLMVLGLAGMGVLLRRRTTK